jgi:hypothetical protein
MVELYLHSPIGLHGVVINYFATRTTLSLFTEAQLSFFSESPRDPGVRGRGNKAPNILDLAI